MLKKTFLKNEKVTKLPRSDDSKKKLPKKSLNDMDNKNVDQGSIDFLAALHSPTSIAEIKEYKANEKQEVLFFSDLEIELGIKKKKQIQEVISLILDQPVKIVITSTIPDSIKGFNKDQNKLKSRALHLRTFLINLGISHNRITIKNYKKRSISQNWKNELVLSFIGT